MATKRRGPRIKYKLPRRRFMEVTFYGWCPLCERVDDHSHVVPARQWLEVGGRK